MAEAAVEFNGPAAVSWNVSESPGLTTLAAILMVYGLTNDSTDDEVQLPCAMRDQDASAA
jgi:hypothetical protein